MPAFGPAPNELLSTVVHVCRQQHSDLTPPALVETVMSRLDVTGQRLADARIFVGVLVLYGSAANGDWFIGVKANWRD
jgi:hypothetical protein